MRWDGFYTGLKIGSGLGRFQWDSTPSFMGLVAGGTTVPTYITTPFSTSMRSLNLIAGGQIGYQWKFGKTIFGFEADFQRAGDRTGRFVPLSPPPPNATAFDVSGPATDILSAKTSFSGSFRTRVGLAASERVLVYGTGGITFANVTAAGHYEARGGIGSPAGSYEKTSTFAGWTTGFGVEFAFTDKWLLGAEYRYSDFGRRSLQLGSLTNSPSGRIWSINNSIGLTSSSVALTLNYKI